MRKPLTALLIAVSVLGLSFYVTATACQQPLYIEQQ